MNQERRSWQRLNPRHVKLSVSDRSLVMTTLFVFAGACVFLMAQVFQERNNILNEGYRQVSLVRDAFAAGVEKTLGDADRALLSVLSLDIRDKLATPNGRASLHEILKSHAQIAGVSHFTLLDSRGFVLASSLESQDLQLDQLVLQDRESHPTSALKPHISGAALSTLGHAKGGDIITLSRPYRDNMSNTDGLFFAAITVEALGKLLQPETLGALGAAGIFRADSVLLARFPDVPNVVGKTYNDLPLFTKRNTPTGTMRYRSLTDHTDRVTAYKTIQDGQVIVYTGLSVDALLAPWREKAMAVIMVLFVLGLAIAALTAYAVNSQRRRARGAAATVFQLERLAAASIHMGRLTDKTAVIEYASQALRELVPSHLSVVSLSHAVSLEQEVLAKSFSDKSATELPIEESLGNTEIHKLLCQSSQPIRMTHREMAAHPVWNNFAIRNGGQVRNWLVVPIVTQDGANLGLMQLFDRVSGEFTLKDEAMCVQLAQLTSVTIEAIRLTESTRAAHTATVMALEGERVAYREIERILATTSDGFFSLDNDWRVRFMNPEAERILGLPSQGVIGKVIWDSIPNSRETESYVRLQDAKKRATSSTYEIFGPAIGKWLEVRVFPYDTGLSVFFRDITAQRHAAQQLQHAQRMESIGQLTGGIAHDFNNLLTVVVGNANNLMDIVEPSSDVHEGLDLIRMAGRRGTELTKRLLAFARRQSLEPCATDLNELVSGIRGLIQRATGEAIDIAMPHCPDIWPVQVDPVQLESTLLNLSINARDAMPNGGKLTFEMTNTEIAESYATGIGDLQAGQYVVLAVSDTGMGMSPDVLAKAFDPFFTTKEVGKGTGLGLSMVYGFVKQSGGHVRLYSELGHGTTVKIYLPRAQRGDAVTALKVTSTADMPRGSEVVLLVEDDDLVRSYTKSALESLGYKVVVANDGHEALAMTNAGMHPHILFTDVVLPGGINGKELANKLRADGIVDCILFVSGYSENAIVHHGRLDPGDLLLTKPFGKHELALKIREALSGTKASAAE